jgi:sterol-4alpha-carboxylate 3-dehydrogenase (decarboxylating)
LEFVLIVSAFLIASLVFKLLLVDAKRSLMMMRTQTLPDVLITGGCGFVGSAIARAIAEKYAECRITVMDINPPGTIHQVPEQANFLKVDVTSADEVEQAMRQTRPTIVIHTAGIVPVLAERFGRRMQSVVWNLNIDGTRIMLDVSKRLGVRAFIFTSSCCVTIDDMRLSYRNINEDWPTSQNSLIYGESKVNIIHTLSTFLAEYGKLMH